jgi:hypothetical protein
MANVLAVETRGKSVEGTRGDFNAQCTEFAEVAARSKDRGENEDKQE